ncbi:MAG: Gfo/Idh/MocA family oxidoreductase [Halanaerobiaceae bacterium]|nr:Gfo/Idh/MocA family oxidoreductase [Halanaerobiaceae bacterium]
MKKPLTVAVIGAGNRGGRVYGGYIKRHQDIIQAVAVAEPDPVRRKRFAEEHDIKDEYQFQSWFDLLERERLADGIIIATMDTMHVEPAIKALEKGYKILLEKPIATDWQETKRLAEKARELDGRILVAHVLRYTPFYTRLKKILSKEIIGEIRFIDHLENIGYYHFAHSYVRGNWRNTEKAAPIILAKSCHDLDLIYWLTGRKCKELSSHATLEYFTADNFPDGAAGRCLDCAIVEDCPYAAQKIYLGEDEGWPVSVITEDLSREGRIKALREGPYGRCVYKCDNNVPEVQSVRMTLEGNLEVNFALTAFSARITRKTIFYGSLGEIRADFEEGEIVIDRFGREPEIIRVSAPNEGHGGGDEGLMNHFVQFLQDSHVNTAYSTTLEDSLESHRIAFAAERAREHGVVVKLDK